MSFVRYNTEDSVINAETVVRGLWSGDNYTLSNFVTASGYTEYYLDVYQTGSTVSGSSIQFDVQYGHVSGSGSVPINSSVLGNTPSRIVYGQYRNLVYGTETTNFSFDGGSTTVQDIFVINISRARYKESLLPGSLNLSLSGGSGTIKLTDDSGTTNLTRFVGENRYYNLISGSNGSYYTSGNPPVYYGLFFPDLNIIVLNPSALNGFVTTPTRTAVTSPAYNNQKLYNSLVAGGSFQLSSQETISSRYFFTRIKNSDFNYTTNPSIIDSNGNLLYTTLINNPQTYITTIGLYNDNNELLGVAKLSKPLAKDFTKEALVRVKLDY